ncbi:MAG: 4Fe-4S dicluster domain-containing protein [Candidatus Hodarchaeales archaeon]|jgi:sulfhydrogenase subunit beta (sulfur reductase)
MIPRIISKENFFEWINVLAESHKFFAPVRRFNDFDYSLIKNANEIAFGFDRTRMSPKNFFFKPEEKLMIASMSKGRPKMAEEQKEQKILFAGRPCDITALNLFDKVFLDEFPDPYYKAHRDLTIVIGMRCIDKCRTCFCGTMNSYSPQSGYDLMITELPTNEYLVEGGTYEGEKLVSDMKKSFRMVGREERKLMVSLFRSIDAAFQPIVPLVGARTIIELSTDGELWKRYQEICLSCGQCVFVCPTCWCFDIRDKIEPDGNGNLDNTARYRVWASCLYKEFHTVSGGHVFKPTIASRLENFYKHKIKGIPERYGVWGCVGCGRCFSSCPVGIDIRESLTEIAGV